MRGSHIGRNCVMLTAGMLILTLLLSVPPAKADSEIGVMLNGEKLSFDVPPQIIEDRTMVPLRAIFEALGYEVEWDDASDVATASSGNSKLSIYDQCHNISSSSGIYECDVPAQIVNDRLLVPARAVAECGGCEVTWNEADRTVLITSNAGTRIGKSPDLSMNTVTLDKTFDDDMQAYEYFRTNVFPGKLFDICDGWVSGRLKFVRTIRKPDTEQAYGELEHKYIDIDNDGSDELVIIAGTDIKLLGSAVPRDIYIWKLNDGKMINILAMSYAEQGRSTCGYDNILSYENENYLVEHRANSKYSGEYLTWEIFKYENNDWVSVFNVISDTDIDKHFINGRSVAENEVTDVTDKIKNLIVYDYSDYPIK